MKKTLSALAALMVLAVLFIGARTIIMRVEMKDGTVRYVDSEALSEFNFIKLDEIPASQDTKYITESSLKDGFCYHYGFFTGRAHNVEIDITYVPNEPKDYIYTIKNWADGCKPMKLVKQDDIVSIPCQSTGYVDPQYGEIWVADRETFATDVLGRDYTGFDYLSDIDETIETLDLKVVYYAPNYGDGKTFAVEAEEKIYTKNLQRITIDIDDYRQDADSQPYMEFKIKNTSGLPTKVGIDYYYVDVAENEMDSVYYYGSSVYNKLDAQNEAAWMRWRNHEYDFVTDFSEGDIATFKVPYSGRACAGFYYSVFDIGGDPEISVRDSGNSYGLVYPRENTYTPETIYGRYHFNVIYSGDYYADMTRLTPPDSTKNVNYQISVPALPNNGTPFTVTVPDMDARTDEGYIPVSVDSTYITTHSTYGRVMAADLYWYCTEYLPSVGSSASDSFLASVDPSVMDPESESLRLNLIYYVPEYGQGTSSFGRGYEYFLVDNKYTSLVSGFDHSFSPSDEPNKGIVSITKVQNGKDIGLYKVVITSVDEFNQTLNDIKANPTNYTSYRAADMYETLEVPVDFEYDTEFCTLVAAFTTDGKFRGVQGIVHNIPTPLTVRHEYLGKGEISDGWILPAFTKGGNPINPLDYMWVIDVYRSKTDPCEYVLAHPWGDDWFLAEHNAYPDKANYANIKIRIEGEYVAVEPQSSGFGSSSWGGPLIIGNYEGLNLAENPGMSLETIVASLKDKDLEVSTFDGELIRIPVPLIGAPGIGDGSFGNSWTNLHPTYIFMPKGFNPNKAPASIKKAASSVPTVTNTSISTDAIRVSEPRTKHNSFDSELNIIPFEKITLSD